MGDATDRFEFGPSAIRLTARQWLAVGGFLALAVWGLGSRAFWDGVEPFAPGSAYRVPYEFSEDYWHLRRWVHRAAEDGRVAVIGDSVVWGEYVAPGDALPAQLERGMSGRVAFANVGVNGLHPAALTGFLAHHCAPLRDRPLLLVFNSLWMSGPRADLRDAPTAEEVANGVGINHPALVPQFFPATFRLALPPRPTPGRAGSLFAFADGWFGESVYVATFLSKLDGRLDNVVARACPMRLVAEHLRIKARQGPSPEPAGARGPIPSIPPNPLAAFALRVSQPADAPHGPPFSWVDQGIPENGMDLDWPVAPDDSFQVRCFDRVLRLARARGNRVYVLMTPFNPYILTGESRRRYDALAAGLTAR